MFLGDKKWFRGACNLVFGDKNGSVAEKWCWARTNRLRGLPCTRWALCRGIF